MEAIALPAFSIDFNLPLIAGKRASFGQGIGFGSSAVISGLTHNTCGRGFSVRKGIICRLIDFFVSERALFLY